MNIPGKFRGGDPTRHIDVTSPRVGIRNCTNVEWVAGRTTIVQDRPKRQLKHNKLREIQLFEKLFKCFCSGQNVRNAMLGIFRLIVAAR